MLPAILNGKVVACTLFSVLPNVPLAFRVDAFGLLFALVASSLWIVTSLYSVGYMRGLDEHSQTRYFCYFAVALSATMGVAFSANLLTMYLFYEMLSLSTYPLVTHHQDAEARRSGRKYLFYLVGTSIGFLLPAMLLSYHYAGALDFGPQGFLAGKIPQGLSLVLLVHDGFRICQGGHDAVSFLAARRHGGPHSGQRAAARGGRGEGGRLLRVPGDRLRFRHGHAGEHGIRDRPLPGWPPSPSSFPRSSP